MYLSQIEALVILKGDAMFLPGGIVGLKIGSQRDWVVRFQPGEVLEIRDLEDHLKERNHYLCMECFANTGEVVSSTPGSYWGRWNVAYQCTQGPHQWELQNI